MFAAMIAAVEGARDAVVSRLSIARAHDVALIAFAALLGLFEGPAEIACVLVLLAALLGRKLSLRASVAGVGILVWVIAGVPGLVAAKLHGTTLSSEDTLRPLLALAFIVGARSVAAADRELLRRLAIAFVAAVAINAAYGWLQVAIGELPLDRWLVKNPRSQQLWVPDQVYAARCASGLFYNRLKLAHVGIVALGLALILWTGELPRRTKMMLGVAASIIAVAVLWTYARMALVAFAVATFGVMVLSTRWRTMLAIAGGAALLALIASATDAMQGRLQTIERDLDIRFNLFKTAYGVFREHPWLGVGHGMYRKVIAPTFDGKGVLLDAHNAVLQVLAETGIVGFLGWSVAVGAALFLLVRRVVATRERRDASVLLDRFALFVLLAYLTLGLTHVATHHAPVAMLFWSALGIASAQRAGLRMTNSISSNPPTQ
jgi:putative inorganic carbon (hco3(-)) transporter